MIKMFLLGVALAPILVSSPVGADAAMHRSAPGKADRLTAAHRLHCVTYQGGLWLPCDTDPSYGRDI